MRGVSVPKAKYIGNGIRVDKTESSAAHFINDAVDVEMDDEHYGKIEKAIRSTRDGTITKVLNVVATIPQWASQVAYFVVTDDAPLWLAPSFNADVLDMVHQNGIAKGRVVSYHNNYNGTYHFEIKIHVE